MSIIDTPTLIKTIEFREIGDERGWLVALEGNINIPFTMQRVYYIYGTQSHIRRGLHAHHAVHQIAVCLAGECKFLLDDGKNKNTILLNSRGLGLVIDPMIWHEMYEFSSDCILMVLASDYYDEADYIRNYAEFLRLANGK
jgi:dTDP-4-dehydrorhamnose 3,5-epimerase-like enzyme